MALSAALENSLKAWKRAEADKRKCEQELSEAGQRLAASKKKLDEAELEVGRHAKVYNTRPQRYVRIDDDVFFIQIKHQPDRIMPDRIISVELVSIEEDD